MIRISLKVRTEKGATYQNILKLSIYKKMMRLQKNIQLNYTATGSLPILGSQSYQQYFIWHAKPQSKKAMFAIALKALQTYEI